MKTTLLNALLNLKTNNSDKKDDLSNLFITREGNIIEKTDQTINDSFVSTGILKAPEGMKWDNYGNPVPIE